VNPRTLRLIVVPVALAALLAACSNSPTSPAPAATVGSTEITDAQLSHDVKLWTFVSAINQQPCGGAAPEGESQEAVCNRFALSNLIQDQLASEYAKANDLTVPDKDVTGIIDNLDTQLGKEKVDQELKKLDLTRADLTTLARKVLLSQQVQQAVVEEQLGDEELRKQYDENLLQYTTVDALHILVDTEAEAQDVYDQVTAPGATQKTFENLAKQVSTDGSAKDGGALGSAPASQYVPEFGEAVAALEPGEVSEPVKTEFGWHVIRLIDKQVVPFEEAKAQLVQSQGAAVFTDWVRTQVENDGLEVNPKYGRYDTETLSVVPLDSTDPSATDAASPSGPTGAVSPTP
jgi:parvulin-like peptidyl-prolyl isomerase